MSAKLRHLCLTLLKVIKGTSLQGLVPPRALLCVPPFFPLQWIKGGLKPYLSSACSFSLHDHNEIVWIFGFTLLLWLFSCSVTSNSLRPHGLQHASFSVPHRLPEFAQVHVHCISDAIQPSHPLMPSSPSALNLSEHFFQLWKMTFPMSQLFASDDQNTGVSASALVLPMSIRGCFPFRLTGLISLLSKGPSGVFSPVPHFKCINSSVLHLLYGQALTAVCDRRPLPWLYRLLSTK